MDLAGFASKLAPAASQASPTDPVMVIMRDGGKLFSVTNVRAEHHADGDGSYTVWVEVEEF